MATQQQLIGRLEEISVDDFKHLLKNEDGRLLLKLDGV